MPVPTLSQIWASRGSPKVAARMAREAGIPLVKRDFARANQIATARHLARPGVDILVRRSRSRGSRLEWHRKRKAEARREARQAAVRADLLRAARVARSMGFTVRASRDRAGRISSYYVQRERKRLRISDHDVPSTWEREKRAEASGRGSYDGSADIYASDSAIRRNVWWTRAFTLAFAGRNIPGFDS